MTIGLPGTGIGGIFYLLLAVCMPIREFIRALKGRTNLRRWGFIALQLFFVFGIAATIWSELWLLNRLLAWTWGTLKINGPLLMTERTLNQTKFMALASATASFVSLTLVITGVHVLRFLFTGSIGDSFHRPQRGHPASQLLEPPLLTPKTL